MLFFSVLDAVLGDEHDLADGVGARGFGIGHCGLCCAASITNRQHIHHFVRFIDNVLGDTCDAYTTLWVISEVQVGVLAIGQQQVTNDLVVDLNVTHLEADLLVSLLGDGHKQVFQNQHHNAWLLQISRHRVSLSGACCSISEHTCIVALYDRWDKIGAGAGVDTVSVDLFIENAIEKIALLTTTMQHIRLLVL